MEIVVHLLSVESFCNGFQLIAFSWVFIQSLPFSLGTPLAKLNLSRDFILVSMRICGTGNRFLFPLMFLKDISEH